MGYGVIYSIRNDYPEMMKERAKAEAILKISSMISEDLLKIGEDKYIVLNNIEETYNREVSFNTREIRLDCDYWIKNKVDVVVPKECSFHITRDKSIEESLRDLGFWKVLWFFVSGKLKEY